MDHTNLPLLLLDNSSVSAALGVGTFKCEYLTFEEAKGIIETYEPEDVLKCFSGAALESVIYDYLDIENRHFEYVEPTEMAINQHAIAFKVYVTPSGTQPIIKIKTPEYEAEAKKIQNIYIHCQYIHREL
ncbi:MAG: hypothetical protein IJ313_14080 [Clostridia bacterium]|nr:hypothetical protein [Clostridia bacterium]